MSNNDKRSHALYPFSFGTNKAGYKQLLKTAGCVLNLSKSPIPFFFYGKLSYLAKYDERECLARYSSQIWQICFQQDVINLL